MTNQNLLSTIVAYLLVPLATSSPVIGAHEQLQPRVDFRERVKVGGICVWWSVSIEARNEVRSKPGLEQGRFDKLVGCYLVFWRMDRLRQ